MKIIKNMVIGKMSFLFSLLCSLDCSINAMTPIRPIKKMGSMRRSEQQRLVGSEQVWVRTSDGQVIPIFKWQIDQMRVLQMLFVYQDGKNSKKNPIDAFMISSENLILMQKAFNIAGNLGEFTVFCKNLIPEQKAQLINAAFAVEAIGLASLLAEGEFSPEIQEKLGATAPGIIEPVVECLGGQIVSKDILKGHRSTVCSVVFNHNNKRIASIDSSGELILWNCRTGMQINKVQAHQKGLSCLALSPNGKYIVSGSQTEYNNLILWDGETGRQIKILQGTQSLIICVAFSPDGKYIVSGSEDRVGNLVLWDGTTGEFIKNLEGHHATVTCLAFSKNGKYLVSGSVYGELIVWDGKTGEQIKSLGDGTSVIGSVAMSNNGDYIVSGSYDNKLILWNTEIGQQIVALEGHEGVVQCVEFSPDGKYIVSGSLSNKNNLILWNGKTGAVIKILQGHNASVYCVAFSPDGNYIVSGCQGEKNCFILWNGRTGKKISLLQGNQKGVSCTAFSFDGQYIVSGSYDSTIILWKLINPELINFIQTNLTLSQARFLYRLYLAKINNVIPVIDERDLDYMVYQSLSADVKKVINIFFPFQLASKFFAQMVEEKKKTYGSLLVGMKLNEKIAEIKHMIDITSDKNSIEYKAFQALLNDLENEAAFESENL